MTAAVAGDSLERWARRWEKADRGTVRELLLPLAELVGRLHNIATLDELSEDALINILTQPKNSIVKQYQRIFEFEGVRLKITPDAMRAVVKIAQKRGTGARGLRSVLEKTMVDIMFELPNMERIKECIITKENIIKSKKPTFVYDKLKKRA